MRPRDINDRVGLASDWMGGEFADQAVLDQDVVILMEVRSSAIEDAGVLEQDPGHRYSAYPRSSAVSAPPIGTPPHRLGHPAHDFAQDRRRGRKVEACEAGVLSAECLAEVQADPRAIQEELPRGAW